MHKADSIAQYERIALDLASRIAQKEIAEGERMSGRSLLASEYSVSPETIRRVLRLLADMKVVEVKPRSGVYVLSADNAQRYLASRQERDQAQELCSRLKGLFAQHIEINRQMLDVCYEIIRAQELPLPSDHRLPNYEVRVRADSPLIGKSLSSLQFWQATGATIVAIRRRQNTILSPGPTAELYDGDTIVFVCAPEAVSAVSKFVNQRG